MADLTSIYPQNGYQPNGAIGGIMAADQFKSAQDNNTLNQLMEQQKYQQNAAKFPLAQRNQELTNQGLEAGLPGLYADSSLKVDKAKISNATNADEINAARSKIAAQMSESELAQHESAVKQAMLDPSPHVRAVGKAMAEQLMEIRKLRVHGEDSASVANIHGNASRDVAAIGANSREAVAKTRAENQKKQALNMEQAAMAGKLDYGRAAVALSFAAEHEENPLIKAELFKRANAMELADQKARQAAAAGVPQVDPSKVPGAPLTTPKPPGPSLGPAGSTPTASPSGDVQKAVTGSGWAWEPDKYDYRIGPDGKPQRKPKGK